MAVHLTRRIRPGDPGMSTESATYPRIRWRHSLIVRVIILCALLVMCLLGAVYVVTRYYFAQVVEEMQEQTDKIGNIVSLYYEEDPTAPLEDLRAQLSREGADIQFLEGEVMQTMVTIEHDEEGQMSKVAYSTLPLPDGRNALLTVRMNLEPQTEIIKAFRNKYLLTLTGGFLLTIVLMVYFIAKTLRPLRELTQRCRQISHGRLEKVEIRKNAGEILALEHMFNGMVSALKDKALMEANLRQAQRLSALGSLAAGVAHDIRNPLNSIKLLSSHASDNLDKGENRERSAQQLRTIRKEVGRLEDIVTGFLSMAREQELNPAPNKVDALLEESLQLIRKDAEQRGVRLLYDLRAGETTLMLDAKQWKRAVINVLLNALEATPEGGRVRLFSRVTDETCEIEVRDDGPGMPAEVAEHAFDPYFTTKHTGTGLGLSITRGIIEEHGGAIQLTSREQGGCQVLITLPLGNVQP